MSRIALGFVLVFAVSVIPVRAVPAPPGALTASIIDTTVVLSWAAPTGAVVAYRLEAGSSPGLSNIASSVVGAAPTFTASGVPAGTYYVRVRAIGTDGESAPSNEIVVVIGVAGSCAAPPNAPGNLSGIVGATSTLVALAWSPASSGCPATAYVLQVGSVPGATNLATLQVAGTSFSVIAPVGTYYVRAVAINAAGSSLPSNELIVAVGGGAAGGQVEVNQATAALGQDSLGNTVVIGEVTNRSSAPAVFVEVALTMRGADGSVVGTDFTFARGRPRRVSSTGTIDDSALAPGELGCFYLITSTPRASVAQASISVSHHGFASAPLTGHVDITSASTTAAGGQLRVTGESRNSSGGVTTFNAPVFYVQRTDGISIGCDYTFVNGATVGLASGGSTATALAPGQTGTFGVTTHAPSNVISVRSWMQWQEAGSGDPLAALAEQTYDTMSRLPNTEGGKRQGIEAWEALQIQRRALARQAGQ